MHSLRMGRIRNSPCTGFVAWLFRLAVIFFLITNIRHPLERFDIHPRPVHQPVKQLECPVIRFFHTARTGVPEEAFGRALVHIAITEESIRYDSHRLDLDD